VFRAILIVFTNPDWLFNRRSGSRSFVLLNSLFAIQRITVCPSCGLFRIRKLTISINVETHGLLFPSLELPGGGALGFRSAGSGLLTDLGWSVGLKLPTFRMLEPSGSNLSLECSAAYARTAARGALESVRFPIGSFLSRLIMGTRNSCCRQRSCT
jgi:hypothetical protein